MDLGLYNAKYPFRKMISFVLPFFKNVDPNFISLWLIPIGISTALLLYAAPQRPIYFLWVPLLIFARMFFGTLDGLVAVSFNKQSSNGEIINRVTPEIADMLMMAALVLSHPNDWRLGVWVLVLSWDIPFFGLVGLTGKKSGQSVGPVGQTDRLAALMFFCVLQYFGLRHAWSIDFIHLFFYWILVGGLVTVTLRCYRALNGNVQA